MVTKANLQPRCKAKQSKIIETLRHYFIEYCARNSAMHDTRITLVDLGWYESGAHIVSFFDKFQL